ncbi:MAG: hypothetical protein JST28_17635 [Acidobacteria bacterium]|nr:hypothetical protein [Acidobacteriota bacterium]
MEADWEFEVAAVAPLIEAYWSGYIDLRSQPERVSELSECSELPALADSLFRLNGTDSPVWTSKADVFTPENIDPDELEASIEQSSQATACYIDVLLRSPFEWSDQPTAERACRQICNNLRAIDLRCCRIDLIVRRALLGAKEHLGATVYFTACGVTAAQAKQRLGECLSVFAETMVAQGYA